MLEVKRNGSGVGRGKSPGSEATQFGRGVDATEYGRRGGEESGRVRRRDPEALARKMARSNSPLVQSLLFRTEMSASEEAWAGVSAARRELERLAAERANLDDLLERRRGDEVAARAELDELKAEQRQVEHELAAMKRRLETDAGLAELLREIGPERIERCAETLGWFDEEAGDASPVDRPA